MTTFRGGYSASATESDTGRLPVGGKAPHCLGGRREHGEREGEREREREREREVKKESEEERERERKEERGRDRNKLTLHMITLNKIYLKKLIFYPPVM